MEQEEDDQEEEEAAEESPRALKKASSAPATPSTSKQATSSKAKKKPARNMDDVMLLADSPWEKAMTEWMGKNYGRTLFGPVIILFFLTGYHMKKMRETLSDHTKAHALTHKTQNDLNEKYQKVQDNIDVSSTWYPGRTAFRP